MFKILALTSLILSFTGVAIADDSADVQGTTYFYDSYSALEKFGTEASNPSKDKSGNVLLSKEIKDSIRDGSIPSARVQFQRVGKTGGGWTYLFAFERIERHQVNKVFKTSVKPLRNSVAIGSDEDQDSIQAKSMTGKLLLMHKHAQANSLESETFVPFNVDLNTTAKKLLKDEEVNREFMNAQIQNSSQDYAKPMRGTK